MYACQHKDLDVVKLTYAGTGSDTRILMVADQTTGITPVISACRRGHLELVTWLVENGARDFDVANSVGYTPIMYVLVQQQFDIVQFLVGAIARTGGSVSAIKAVNHLSLDGASPLSLTLEMQHPEWSDWLIHARADPCYADNVARPPRENELPVRGRTLIHRMAGLGNLKAMEWLIASAAQGQVTTADDQGCTPMILACQRGDLDMVRFLYRNGAKATIGTPDAHGKTPIQFACLMGHLHIVKWLKKKGAETPHKTLMLELSIGLMSLKDSEEKESLTEHGCVIDEDAHYDLFSYLQSFACASCKEVSSEKLRTCARCREVRYCSDACQQNHWKAEHSTTCIRDDY